MMGGCGDYNVALEEREERLRQGHKRVTGVGMEGF